MRAITTMPTHTAVRRENRETGQGENNASAAMSFSSVSVISNALRLRKLAL